MEMASLKTPSDGNLTRRYRNDRRVIKGYQGYSNYFYNAFTLCATRK